MTVHAALEHRFRVHCDHRGLAQHLETVLAPLRTSDGGGPVSEYEVVVDRARPGPFELRLDGACVVSSDHPARPYARLLQQINRHATRSTAPDATLLHSAAAAGRDGLVLFPAPMESGKSTLVAGLVRAGWAYLTDELVAVDADDAGVRGLPRAISLDPGSWALFPELAPNVDEATAARLPAQWQIPATSIGPLAPDGLHPAAVVTHRYDPTSPTALVELDAVACLRQLITCCFSFDEHTARDLDALARLLDRTPCFELNVGTLDGATDLLNDTFGAAGEVRGSRGVR
jgi:hypothetical protein